MRWLGALLGIERRQPELREVDELRQRQRQLGSQLCQASYGRLIPGCVLAERRQQRAKAAR